MKKVILTLFVLLLSVVAGGAFYVANIDWNQHKAKIADQFYQATGKYVEFGGNINFRFFPTPYLSAGNVRVYNDKQNTDKALLEIHRLSAELVLKALLRGNIEVKKMLLENAVINIDWDDDKINWQSDLSVDQRQMMEDTPLVLNSVSVKDAVVNLESQANDWNLQLTNLNGEVSAQSMFGPFHIEGNYMKGNAPEGFALSIGKLSENFATSLNAVISHPRSESYLRFDGSFHLTNRVINGNVIVDTQHLSDFFNDNISVIKIPSEYNKAAAIGFDIMLSPQNLHLSNIVIKYAETQGAGEIEFPLEDSKRSEMTLDFKFSDLDLVPFVGLLQSFVDKYREEDYAPNYPFDIDAEIKAVRASYQGQGFKDLNLSLSSDNDTLTLHSVDVVLPGDTALNLKGNISPVDGQIHYNVDAKTSSNDFLKTLRWLGLEPTVSAVSVYKKMSAEAHIEGGLESFTANSVQVMLDKSTFDGQFAATFTSRPEFSLSFSTDSVNIDNYIHALPEEERSKSWLERINYRFGQMTALNDFDLVLDAKANLLIYEGMPFEKTAVKLNLLQGKMDIESCQIGQVANASVNLQGKISGFGGQMIAENLNYQIQSNDISSLINKLELNLPNFDYKKLNALNFNGTVNSNGNQIALNTNIVLGQLNATYQGRIKMDNGFPEYDGNLSLKHPEFVDLLSGLKLDYIPTAKTLGQFNGKAHLSGSSTELDASELNATIGYSNFSGKLNINNKGERPNLTGEFSINKFEPAKFIPRTSTIAAIEDTSAEAEAMFLHKPIFSRQKFNYSPYLNFDFLGQFNIEELNYQDYAFQNSSFRLELLNGVLSLPDFAATYKETPLQASVQLTMTDAPLISANAKLKDAEINRFNLGGKTYNLKGGKFSTRFDISSSADSESAFIENLKGKAEFSAENSELGGLDLAAIIEDLTNRSSADGLGELMNEKTTAGHTSVQKLNARATFEKGQFILSDANIQIPGAGVRITGDGDLKTWDMDVAFHLKNDAPKQLPEYGFSLKNSLENPTVELSIDDVLNMYKTQEQQKVDAQRAEMEAEKQYWNELIDAQKKDADSLVLSTRNNLEKDLESKTALASRPETVTKYTVLKQNIAQTLADLIETMGKVDENSANEQNLQLLTDANKQAAKVIEGYEQSLQNIYLNDLRQQNDAEYKKVVDLYNQSKQEIFEYNTALDKYRERLSNIITDYKIDDDNEVAAQMQKIDNEIANIEQINEKASTETQEAQNRQTSKDFEGANQILTQNFDVLSQNRQHLIDEIAVLHKMLEPKVKKAEQDYADKLEQEDNQRRIEENTGSISIKKLGKTVKVVRDIEDIKNTEREISNDEVRVLDFSKDKQKDFVPADTDTTNVVKKSRNLR